MLKHKLFIFLLTFNSAILAMEQYQTSYYNQLINISNKPEYKNLKKKFGDQQLINVLGNYFSNSYAKNLLFQQWSSVANLVIGNGYTEERNYFLVNVMLHSNEHLNGLNILHDIFSDKNSTCLTKQGSDTPQGFIDTYVPCQKYTQAMEVCNGIRTKLFARRPLVLVEKPSVEITPEIKWSFFKGLAVVSYLISSCFEKKDQNKNEKNKCNHTNRIDGFLALSEILQKVEEDAQKLLKLKYPILKDYTVKSLVDDKVSWIYDPKNWIFYGSLACMTLLLFCLFRGHLPHVYRTMSVLIIT